MDEYQKFPINNFRVGLSEEVEPWLIPKDAYQSILNATLYRGVLEKVSGYLLYAKMTYRNIAVMSPAPDGVTKTFTLSILGALPVTSNFIGYGTIDASTHTADIVRYASDASATVINLAGVAGTVGTVNTVSGAVSITFNTAPPSNTYSAVFFQWDSAVPSPGPYAIMGIKTYYTSAGTKETMVFDQKRMGLIEPITGNWATLLYDTNFAVQEIPHSYYITDLITGDGTTTVFTYTDAGSSAVHAPFVPGTFSLKEYDSTGAQVTTLSSDVIDNGTGGLIGVGSTLVSSGSVNYSTGAWTITFGTAPATGNYFDASTGIYGDIFTGNISNFFTVDNYKYCAFFTNSIDPIMYFDGASLLYLNTNITPHTISVSGGVPVFDISACLHLSMNRERLCLLSPTVFTIAQVNTIYWSNTGDPFDYTNGGVLNAPTSQPIRTFGFVNTDMIVRFSNSERIFRYTADAFSPFRFDSTNNTWPCDAPYGEINYNTHIVTVGKPAIVQSDGVNIKRADERIPDFTDPTRLAQQTPLPWMNQDSIQQCYGERFDDLKEGWMCYNSQPTAENGVTASDNILAFSYLDDSYSIYEFPLSCLGFGSLDVGGPTWGDTETPWQEMDTPWNSYAFQTGSLLDLGGDQFDNVFLLNVGNVATNVAGDIVPISFDVITKNFNPFVEEGELCRFGYLDLFVSAYNTTVLRVQFYVNDQLYVDASGTPQGYYLEVPITFTTTDAMSPSTNQIKVWKRIYVGAVGKEHTIRFYQSQADLSVTPDQPVYIHGMNLWMKPAGRIFN